MSKNYENGVIATNAGGSTDLSVDFETTGAIYWVDSVNGNDSNAGTNRNEAKATLSSAITAATANNGDMIILESGHTETLTSSLTISKAGLRIFGLGTGSNKPNFTIDAAIDGFGITGANVEINGLRFPVGTTTGNTSRINIDAAGVRITDCVFLCGAQDAETITITANGLYPTIKGCSFTISADGGDSAIEVESASIVGMTVDDCTFDGGDYNWDNAALYSAVAHTEFVYRDNTLTNKASIIHTAASKGQAIGTVSGDGSYIQI